MPLPILAPFLITSALQWVARHHEDIIPIAQRGGEFMSDVLSQGGLGKVVQQIGNTVIWNRLDGASHVIGMLDQLDSRIDGLDTAQHGLQIGLSGLKSLSMVTLGFSSVSVGLLASQFVFLTHRLNQIQKATKKIQLKIDQTIEAQLQAGLDFLRAADTATGTSRIGNYHDALGRARDAGHFFRSQAVDPGIHEEDLRLIQFYSRKYFLALSIEIGCLMGLDDTDQVKARLNAEEPNLKTIASQVYKQTLAENIESYLAPELRDVATLESISTLLEQAQNLGCVSREIVTSPAAVFETNRKSIYSSGGFFRSVLPSSTSFRKETEQKLQSAQATFEEVTRILSWREAVGHIVQNGHSPTEIAIELRHFRDAQQTPTTSSPFVAYSLSRKET